jgi:hypothetical protein
VASRKSEAVVGGPAKARRSAVTQGDEVGAAELGRRVAENLKRRRKGRGMSLDELAHASGVSRAALSQIETFKSNPTVGLLWKIAVGLGVPFTELLGEPTKGISVLRRGDAQVLRSTDGKLESRPLAPAGSSPIVELYELRLSARSAHSSEAHTAGTQELVVVLAGALRLRVDAEVHDLGPGDSVSFAADRPHTYEHPGASEARYHNAVIYERV